MLLFVSCVCRGIVFAVMIVVDDLGFISGHLFRFNHSGHGEDFVTVMPCAAINNRTD